MGLAADGADKQMINFLLLGAVVLFIITILIVGIRGYRDRFESIDRLASRLRPVNIEALKNLLSEEQDRYFALNLSADELKSVRRERNLVAVEYVWRIAKNASLVTRVAELASRSTSPEVASTGERIANAALQTRLLALRTTFLLVVGLVFPGRPLRLPNLQNIASLNKEVNSIRTSHSA